MKVMPMEIWLHERVILEEVYIDYTIKGYSHTYKGRWLPNNELVKRVGSWRKGRFGKVRKSYIVEE